MKNVVLPSMVMPIPTVGVIVDTSGSMSEKELGEGLGQIRHVLSAIRAEVYLAICDCDVHNVRKIRTTKEVQASLVGGGGSDMSPAIAELEKLKCDFIIGISDCMVGYPDTPPRAKVIWLRTGDYTSDPPFGDVVDIQLDG
jgi:predicted metal-dependent peptidase